MSQQARLGKEAHQLGLTVVSRFPSHRFEVGVYLAV